MWSRLSCPDTALARALRAGLAAGLVLTASTAARADEVVADFDGDGAADLAVGVPLENPGSIADAGIVQIIYGVPGSGLAAARNEIIRQGAQTGGTLVDDPEPGDRFGSTLAAGDFDRDGFADLAIGVPFEDVPSGSSQLTDVGAVNVVYGSAGGLVLAGSQILVQGFNTIQGTPQAGDRFGSALTVGDFDGDGFDDLAIGVPLDDLNGADAGAVNVVYGGATGLQPGGNQIWNQGSPGVLGTADAGDQLGFALAAGDFDGDLRDDLAIGVPLENRGIGNTDAGVVNVLYGSAGVGLTADGNQLWHQGASDALGSIEDNAEPDDRYGFALAAGDFNIDGTDDLAVGIPFEDIGSQADAGAVSVIYGSRPRNGLTAFSDQLWFQGQGDEFGVLPGAPEAGDNFGVAVAAGDFDGDGVSALVIGVTGEDTTGGADTGVVHVLYGNGFEFRLLTLNTQLWHQDGGDAFGLVLDANEPGDRFGRSFAIGDFDGDTADDLAIGVPLESVGAVAGAGAVNVLYGNPDGSDLSTVGNQLWTQRRLDAAGDLILEIPETDDRFGSALD